KCPMRRALGEGSRCRRGCQHLDLPGQIVSHHSAEGEDLVSCQASRGQRIKGGIRLGVPKDRLLGTTSIMEQNHTLSRFGLVGDNHFVIEVQVPGLPNI
ncbi:MAG: hypothetical protein ABIL06_07850, partial [Pseudomonadota bacterium]